MHVLGIDPGIGRTGWGIISLEKNQVKVVSYGCIETDKKLSHEERLVVLYNELQEIISAYTPQTVGIEELFFNTNVTTAISVGQARGVILLAATQHDLPIASYTPSQVKMALSGYGKADKKQVGEMVKKLLKLSHIPTPDDTADALAVAITHAFSYKLKKLQ
jgi:crossover junction endodeoxyribonuclease RuvC